MANYNARTTLIKGLIKNGSRSMKRTGNIVPMKCDIMVSPLFKYGVTKVPNNYNVLPPVVTCNTKITSLNRPHTIRSGMPAFTLTTFTRVSPRKRPWDGINRRNTL